MKTNASLELSIIVAVYNEDPKNLTLLLERLNAVLTPSKLGYEVVFVNDGSKEPTASALRMVAADYDYVKLIELSRNFGQQAAISAGLDHSAGSAIVNIDSDLQDPPELIPLMVQRWKEGFDVVYATRSTRRDRFLKRLSAHLFYRVLAAVSSVEIPRDTGDFRLMDRRVVDTLRALPEKTRFLRGLVPWLGFRQCAIPVDRDAREIGESTYTLRKLFTLCMDGLLSFSVAPLYLLPIFGLLLCGAGSIGILWSLLLNGFAHIDGPVLLSAFAWLTGFEVVCTGIVAVYLSKVLDETRARPTYIVGRRLGRAYESDYHQNIQQLHVEPNISEAVSSTHQS